MYLLFVVEKTASALGAIPPKEGNLAHHFFDVVVQKNNIIYS